MNTPIDHITTKEMAEECAEEVRRRERVYSAEVRAGRMSEESANSGIAAMKAAQCRLERLTLEEQGQTELF